MSDAFITKQVNVIRDAMTVWGGLEPNAKVIVCSDLVHLWGALFDNPNVHKILIMYNGETVRGDFGVAAPLARVDRNFIVVISRGRYLTQERGQDLTETVQNARPLFEVVAEGRDVLRALQFDPDWCEYPIDFKDIVPFPTEGSGRIVDAYQVDFSVGTQLELITPSANVVRKYY